MAKTQLLALLFLSVKAGGGGGGQGFIKLLMGEFFIEILVGGDKRGDSIFCGSSVGGTCQGWSNFP